MKLRIDPEFRDKIPPLTDDEYKQLRDNILEAGEVYEPIAIWNDVIVDGHNRYKIIQENPEIKWRTRELEFADKWAAFDWMYRNQLGRRNLTDEQRTYMIGKMYEARKNTNAFKGNQYTVKSGGAQNGHDQQERRVRQDEAIGKELGIGHNTVRRAEKFAKGVDAVREVNPEAADKILGGKVRVNKPQIAAVAQMDEDEIEAVTQAILDDAPIPEKPIEKPAPEKPKRVNTGRFAADRELYRIINEANAELEDVDRPDTFNIDDMVSLIRQNGQNYVDVLTHELSTKAHLLKDSESKRLVFEAIAEVIQKIVKLRGEYTK